MPLILGANSVTGGYEVDNSLRFNSGSSDYLSRTTWGTPTDAKKFTLSLWVKRGTLGVRNTLVGSYDNSSPASFFFSLEANDTLYIALGGSSDYDLQTTQLFRDVSAWYHIVYAVDSTQATASNRQKLYINGSQVTAFNYINYTTLNSTTLLFNNSYRNNIGSQWQISGFLNGYMSEFYFIDGQALDPDNFGEFDSATGIWKPIAYTGTYGTNGFYLEFKDSSALGDDTSGNSNDFTVNNLTSIDQTTDTPTNNFATMNPLFPAGGTLTFSQGNTSISAPNDGLWKTTLSTMASQNGKWYMEFKSGGNYAIIGVCDFNVTTRGVNGYNFASSTQLTSYGYGYYNADGSIRYEGGIELNPYGDTYGSGDIIGIALDCDNNNLYFSKNGVWQNSGDPESGATGTGAVSLDSTAGRFWGFAFSIYQTNDRFANFGNSPFTITPPGNSDANGYGNFEYEVPSGYYALNTKNLADYG
jgi:hypothetical protein